MLAGEYSVLEGGRSLALCVDRRLRASVVPGSYYRLSSNLWPKTYEISDPEIPKSSLLPLLRWAVDTWKPDPFYLKIDSDINVSDGLGSSSAVCLGALAAIAAAGGRKETLWQLAELVWTHQRQRQGFASGYDVATQCQGGLVLMEPDFTKWPGQLNSLPWRHLAEIVHPYHGGGGAPTGELGSSTLNWLRSRGQMLRVRQACENLIDQLLEFNRKDENLDELIKAAVILRQEFEEHPKFPVHLLKALRELPGFDRSWTFKTSGAGGEDTILLLGRSAELQQAHQCLDHFGWHPLSVTISPLGTQINLEEP